MAGSLYSSRIESEIFSSLLATRTPGITNGKIDGSVRCSKSDILSFIAVKKKSASESEMMHVYIAFYYLSAATKDDSQ
jgi:hypothetical protein